MASEWAVVAAAGVGAASGLVTLLVNKRFDARDRRDDRAWAIRQQNVEQRREIYGELLGAGEEIWGRARAVAWVMSPVISPRAETPEDDLQLSRVKDLRRALTEYRSFAAQTEVAAVDHVVVRLSRKVERLARDVVALGAIADYDAPPEVTPEIRQLTRDIRATLRELAAACRRDLGFGDLPDPLDDSKVEEAVLRYGE